jgi:hypothetical protein
MRTSGMLASVTSTLASREQRNSESNNSSTAADSASDCQCSSGHPAAARALPGMSLASQCQAAVQGRPPAGPVSQLLQELHLASCRRAVSQSPGRYKEECQHQHWLPRCDKSFTRHQAGAPGFRPAALFGGNNIIAVTNSGQSATKGVFAGMHQARTAYLIVSNIHYNRNKHLL